MCANATALYGLVTFISEIICRMICWLPIWLWMLQLKGHTVWILLGMRIRSSRTCSNSTRLPLWVSRHQFSCH